MLPRNTRSPENSRSGSRKQRLPGVWPGVWTTSSSSPATSITSPSDTVRTSFGRTVGTGKPAPQASGSVRASSSSLWMYKGSSVPQTAAAAPMWSMCPCVARTADGRLPAALSNARTRSGKKPGSMTTASFASSLARSQQLVAKGLSENTSRYMATANRIGRETRPVRLGNHPG